MTISPERVVLRTIPAVMDAPRGSAAMTSPSGASAVSDSGPRPSAMAASNFRRLAFLRHKETRIYESDEELGSIQATKTPVDYQCSKLIPFDNAVIRKEEVGGSV